MGAPTARLLTLSTIIGTAEPEFPVGAGGKRDAPRASGRAANGAGRVSALMSSPATGDVSRGKFLQQVGGRGDALGRLGHTRGYRPGANGVLGAQDLTQVGDQRILRGAREVPRQTNFQSLDLVGPDLLVAQTPEAQGGNSGAQPCRRGTRAWRQRQG